MDKEKYISIIKEHQKLIYKICRSYCQDVDKRKDLEQEILLQLWKSFERYNGTVKISTWMYRVALNTAISFYRNEKTFSKNREPLDRSFFQLSYEEYDTEQDERIALLYEFIGQLNEMDKALILLYLESYKYVDIANVLGITETNVATKVSRIKKSLKNQFNNKKEKTI